MVRDEIRKIIEKALKELGFKAPDFSVKQPREKNYGDYSTNVAMIVKQDPIKIVKNIKSDIFEKIEIAKPGFINFFLSKECLIRHLKDKTKNIGKGKKINVEFISANPTGPLTLGNGRGGFMGDVLANVLKKAGYEVTKEFYINDRGKQIEDLKQGLYKKETRTAFEIQKENKKIIENKLKIKFDVWFSEKSLYEKKEVDKVIAFLRKKNLIYEKDKALWFESTKFGDDKDRVLIKEDGEYTYLASDIAYLKNKFERGFRKLIFFWGADHHGYVKRIKAAAKALGYKKEQVEFIVMQLVTIKERGEKVKMSKRAGIFITLEELVKEVGLDAVRFFFLQRAADSHLVFDMELAKKKSQENPVYYVQYAYARICSMLKKSKIQNPNVKPNPKSKIQNLLKDPTELALVKQIIRSPEIIEDTAKDYQVQRIPQYATDLATSFHQFYRDCKVISDDKNLTEARLGLISATKIVLKNTLDLMGISAPEKM